MGMTIYKFCTEALHHIRNIEGAFLFPYLGIKDNMKQNISKFLHYVVHVAVHNRVGKFESLLYRLRAQRFDCLFPVPRTFFTQIIHYVQQMQKGIRLPFSQLFLIHIC